MHQRAVVAGLAGCIAVALAVGLLRPGPEGQAAWDAEAAAANVHLAQVPGPHLHPVKTARLRVLVTPTGVSVDTTAMVAGWSEATRAALRADLGDDGLLVFFDRNLVPLAALPRWPDEGELSVRPLAAVLEHVQELERQRVQLEKLDVTSTHVSVLFNEGLPFSSLVSVIYTLGQADLQQHFLVSTPDGPREIDFEMPSYRSHTGDYASLVPELALGPDGAVLRIQGAAQAGRGAEPWLPEPQKPSPSARGKIVRDDIGQCVLSLNAHGAPDRDRLVRLLRQVRTALTEPPPKAEGESKAGSLLEQLAGLEDPDAVQILPESSTPWRVIAMLADAAAEAGYSAIRLSAAVRATEAVSALQCQQAVLASSLKRADVEFFLR